MVAPITKACFLWRYWRKRCTAYNLYRFNHPQFQSKLAPGFEQFWQAPPRKFNEIDPIPAASPMPASESSAGTADLSFEMGDIFSSVHKKSA
jgi:hypothetical protein